MKKYWYLMQTPQLALFLPEIWGKCHNLLSHMDIMNIVISHTQHKVFSEMVCSHYITDLCQGICQTQRQLIVSALTGCVVHLTLRQPLHICDSLSSENFCYSQHQQASLCTQYPNLGQVGKISNLVSLSVSKLNDKARPFLGLMIAHYVSIGPCKVQVTVAFLEWGHASPFHQPLKPQ